MKLLPILWAEPPTASDWLALGRAREASGYTERVMPAKAVDGSPGRILAIGIRPDWLCEYNYVADVGDPRLPYVLQWCLDESVVDKSAPTYADMLSDWFGGPVKFLREEPYDA